MQEVITTTITDNRKLYNLIHERNYRKSADLAHGARITVTDYAIMGENGEPKAVLFVGDDGVVYAASGKAFVEEFCGISGFNTGAFEIVIEKCRSRQNREYTVPRWAE